MVLCPPLPLKLRVPALFSLRDELFRLWGELTELLFGLGFLEWSVFINSKKKKKIYIFPKYKLFFPPNDISRKEHSKFEAFSV